MPNYEVIQLEALQERCSNAQSIHFNYTVETPDSHSVTVDVSYHEHNFYGDLKYKLTVIGFTFPCYSKDGQTWVVLDVIQISPADRFWSPDLLVPLLEK